METKEIIAGRDEASFTPGPWAWKPDSTLPGYYIETVDKSHAKTFIGEVGGGLQSMFEVCANAKLIAASPEMYAALRYALFYIRGTNEDNPTQSGKEAIGMIEAALHKAVKG